MLLGSIRFDYSDFTTQSITMSTSPELQTLETCTPHLKVVLKNSYRDLVDFLSQEGFIRNEVREDVQNPRSVLTDRAKAVILLEAIKDAVALDKDKYHHLVDYFGRSGAYFESIVKRLTEEYRFREADEPTSPQGDTTGCRIDIGVAVHV